VRIEWLRRFVEKKSWFPIRVCQVFETHLNRRRDFGGNLDRISISTSRGREVEDIVFPTPALLKEFLAIISISALSSDSSQYLKETWSPHIYGWKTKDMVNHKYKKEKEKRITVTLRFYIKRIINSYKMGKL
jgi:hypothetical protein